MKYLFVAFFTLFAISTYGQIKPEFFPEDIFSEDIKIQCYCKPGVRYKSRSKGLNLSYGWLGNSTFDSEDQPFLTPLSKYKNLQHIEFDFKVPLINKDAFKLLVGYKYRSEFFEFEQIGTNFSNVFGALNNERLKNNSLSLIISKPLNETKYLAFRLRYSSNGNYDNLISFQSKHAVYKLLGLYAIKPNEDFEWGIGLNVSKSFRRTNILPFLILNKTFNKKWGLESALPGFIFARYNANSKNIYLAGIEYDSQSYRMDLKSTNDDLFAYDYNRSGILASIRLEHQFYPWFWGNIKTGYQINFSSDFESKNEFSTEFNANPSNSLFFHVGIFISPHNKH